MPPADPESGPPDPIAVLIEWRAEALDLEAAHGVAARTAARLELVPGLLSARFFGDFETGVHYYLLTWRDQAALEAYMRSEEMLGIRSIAQPYATGRPTRQIMTDYSAYGVPSHTGV